MSNDNINSLRKKWKDIKSLLDIENTKKPNGNTKIVNEKIKALEAQEIEVLVQLHKELKDFCENIYKSNEDAVKQVLQTTLFPVQEEIRKIELRLSELGFVDKKTDYAKIINKILDKKSILK